MKNRLHRLSWITQIKYRWHLRRAGWSNPVIGLVSSPEPWTIGSFDRGQQLVSGRVLTTGHIMEISEGSVWSLPPPSDLFAAELHGFEFLDDLAAFGDHSAKTKAQAWVLEWISGFGMGKGPGWTADLTGRRLIRWINNSSFLMNQLSKSKKSIICQSMALQTLLLVRSWRQAPPGYARFEALCGLVCATQFLAGMGQLLGPAIQALERECQTQIYADGTIISRNPEELLNVFSLLTWVKKTLNMTKTPIPDILTERIARMAPVLRCLRHGDGTLARFHGGGQGSEHILDQALAISGVRPSVPQDRAMGFARLSAGATSLIMDAAAPPLGPARFSAHASTCAFELSVGRNRLIINCGSGLSFGDDWQIASRSTASHATLGIEGVSSSRFATRKKNIFQALKETAKIVSVQKTDAFDGVRLHVNHSGYQISHGLIHARTLDLPVDGKGLVGEDKLYAPDAGDIWRFDKMREKSSDALQYAVRFHLHPDVVPSLDFDGNAVSLTLVNGDVWIFRHYGANQLLLEGSVYFEEGRLHPRSTSQITLSGEIKEITTRVRWSLAKASENPQKAV